MACIGDSKVARTILELAPAFSTSLKPTVAYISCTNSSTCSSGSWAKPRITTTDSSTSSSLLFGGALAAPFLTLVEHRVRVKVLLRPDVRKRRHNPSTQPCQSFMANSSRIISNKATMVAACFHRPYRRCRTRTLKNRHAFIAEDPLVCKKNIRRGLHVAGKGRLMVSVGFACDHATKPFMRF